MTPEQQRIAIAEACGRVQRADGFWFPAGKYYGSAGIPDYLNNLNAMREALDTLNDDHQWQFIQHLNEITRNKDHNDPDDWFIQNTDWSWRMVNATESQRAEAFLRTIGKWEESQ
jgi:hypothetical protein